MVILCQFLIFKMVAIILKKEFLELLREWDADVRTVAKNKGNPPKLY